MNIAALAVIIDSAVTLGVGWQLNKTAKKEVRKAVEEIEPAIRQSVTDIADQFQTETKKEIVKAINKMLPVIIAGMKAKEKRDGRSV